MKGFFRDKRGLTLIEILVSVAILSIGILALAQLFPVGLKSSQRSLNYTRLSSYLADTLNKLQYAVMVYEGEDARQIQEFVDSGYTTTPYATNPPYYNKKGYYELWYRYREGGPDSSMDQKSPEPFTAYYDEVMGDTTAYTFLFLEPSSPLPPPLSSLDQNHSLKVYITLYWKEADRLRWDTFPIYISNPYTKEWGQIIK